MRLVVGVATALAISWLLIAVAMLRASQGLDSGTAARAARVVPDSLRLLRRLLADPMVPKGVRWRLLIALVYNVQPLNLIPDFIPVIGFADNVVVTAAWALRAAVRVTGVDAVERHWPGSEGSLLLLYRALHIPRPDTYVTAAADGGLPGHGAGLGNRRQITTCSRPALQHLEAAQQTRRTDHAGQIAAR